tara:strand:- start:422 stop:1036 length:615 start_codon:yes stop_codon:yes gene_type:complete
MEHTMKKKLEEYKKICRKEGLYTDSKTNRLKLSAWGQIKAVAGDEDVAIKTSLVDSHKDIYIVRAELYYKGELKRTAHSSQKNQYAEYDEGGKLVKPFISGLQAAETFAIARCLSFFGLLEEDITSKEEHTFLQLEGNIKPLNEEAVINKILSAPHLTRLEDLMSRQFKDWLVEYKQTNYDGYSNLMQKVVEKKSELENEGVIS